MSNWLILREEKSSGQPKLEKQPMGFRAQIFTVTWPSSGLSAWVNVLPNETGGWAIIVQNTSDVEMQVSYSTKKGRRKTMFPPNHQETILFSAKRRMAHLTLSIGGQKKKPYWRADLIAYNPTLNQ